ncbi:MAG: hypothetical protein ACOYM2_09500 [Rectinemataceae bacterium]
MSSVLSTGHDGEGFAVVYRSGEYVVGIKNWRKANDLAHFTEVERHLQTDESFILLSGSCVILSAVEEVGRLRFSGERMVEGRVYTIPRSLWHTTITQPGVKLALVEAAGTSSSNSELRLLSPGDLEAARKAVSEATSAA